MAHLEIISARIGADDQARLFALHAGQTAIGELPLVAMGQDAVDEEILRLVLAWDGGKAPGAALRDALDAVALEPPAVIAIPVMPPVILPTLDRDTLAAHADQPRPEFGHGFVVVLPGRVEEAYADTLHNSARTSVPCAHAHSPMAYFVAIDPNDPAGSLTVEAWTDAAAFQTHVDSPPHKARVADLIAMNFRMQGGMYFPIASVD